MTSKEIRRAAETLRSIRRFLKATNGGLILQVNADVCGTGCKGATGWRAQFARPTGWRGWLVGQVMAIKNKQRSLWTLSLLHLLPEDRVLEIGFGSGADIARVAAQVSSGFDAGVDHSDAMLRLASKRNENGIHTGRVELRRVRFPNCPTNQTLSTQHLPSMSRNSGQHPTTRLEHFAAFSNREA